MSNESSEELRREQRKAGISQAHSERTQEFEHLWDIWHEMGEPETPDLLRRSDARSCVEIMTDAVKDNLQLVEGGRVKPLTPEDIERIYQKEVDEMRQGKDHKKMLSEGFTMNDVTKAAIGELGWTMVARHQNGTDALNKRIEAQLTLVDLLTKAVSPITPGRSTPKNITPGLTK